jgi:hypothetical protein
VTAAPNTANAASILMEPNAQLPNASMTVAKIQQLICYSNRCRNAELTRQFNMAQHSTFIYFIETRTALNGELASSRVTKKKKIN